MNRQLADHTILIVDDSEDMRSLLQELLEYEGYTIFTAEDGPMAISLAQEHLPDLIFMDISLPGMTGWEAVEHLLAMDNFKTTPIIAVTAHTSPQDEERSLAIGCVAHISKPFDIDTIVEYIATFLHKT